MKNINITDTFQEYVNSIAEEIRRLLTSKNYSVRIEDSFWGTATAEEGGTPVKVVFINEDDGGPSVNFSIAELEFLTLQ